LLFAIFNDLLHLGRCHTLPDFAERNNKPAMLNFAIREFLLQAQEEQVRSELKRAHPRYVVRDKV
jgi:hypothetical protein